MNELAYYIWNFLKRHDGERSTEENWLLAESIMQGNRPTWLFSQFDFHPWSDRAIV